MQGSFLPAIEDFFSASRHSLNPIYRLLALTNTMLCLENLGIDSSGVSEEVEALRQIPSIQSHPVFLSNEAQLRAYRMRQALRLGHVKEALAEAPNGLSLEVLDQSSYFARFLSLLPFTRFFQPISKTESARLLSHPQSFFQKGYGMRTLICQTNAEDQGYIRLSDRIDRLYLWTWQWLNAPETFSADRLMEAVNDVLMRLDLSRATLEDQVLLRNSIGWLGLADEAFMHHTRLVSQKLQAISSGQFPMYELEWGIIQLLKAKRQGQRVVYRDTLTSLKKHALWNSEEIKLSDLVKNLDSHPITTRILSREMRARKSDAKTIRVDLNSYVITDLTSQKKMLSQPMSLAFHLFSRESEVELAGFAREVFGLYQYDAIIHQPKIFNLLARIRTLVAGQLTLQVRGGVILCQGEWKSIELIAPSELSKLLRGESLGFYLARGKIEGELVKKNIAFARIRKKFGMAPSFSREDVQQEASLSKSTANRILEKLTQDGKIERLGYGKNIVYRFKAMPGEVKL